MDLYEPYAHFDESNDIHPTAIIHPNVKMGKNNKIGAYCVIGSNGEIRGVSDFLGHVEIGDGNVISEMVTIQRPAASGQVTRIGNDNIIMAHSHVGHDVQIGNGCELSTGTIVGGYAKIKRRRKNQTRCNHSQPKINRSGCAYWYGFGGGSGCAR